MVRSALVIAALLCVSGCWLAEPGRAARADEPPARITFDLNLADVPEEEREAISARTVQIFLSRLLGLGLPDPTVFRQAASSIQVAVPSDVDLDEVVVTLTGRGLVEFREQDGSGPGWKPIQERGSDGSLKPLTSAHFRPKSHASLGVMSGRPQVTFELDDEGAVLMEAASRRLIDKPMGIFYDDKLLIAPVVRSVLHADGVIVGLASPAEAKRLAVQLNSGAQPVNVTVQP